MPADTWYYFDPEREEQGAHGPFSVEQLAELLRRALGMLKRLGMTDDVWRRVQALKPR